MKFIYATWETMPQPVRRKFAELFSVSEEEAESTFNLQFCWFNVVHEMGHLLRKEYGTSEFDHDPADCYAEEQAANDFAAAFWRENGQQKRLDLLETRLKHAVSGLADPVPGGMSPQDYFNENYFSLMQVPEVYGYYQMTFILNSLKKEEKFVDVLRTKITPDAGGTGPVEDKFCFQEVDSDLPAKTASYLRTYLAPFNVNLPAFELVNEFTPVFQRVSFE